MGLTLKKSVILILTVANSVNFKLSGEDFFMISISKMIMHCDSPVFYYTWISSDEFW